MTSTPSIEITRRGALAAGLAATVLPAIAQPDRPALRIVGPWEIKGLAPAVAGDVFTRMQITETLLGAHDDGTPLPALAQSWSMSADGLVWRFVLRPRARFHDSTPVTAAEVVRCLQAARTPPLLLSQAPIVAIEAEGAGAVVVRLRQPHGALPALLSHSTTLLLAPSSYSPDGQVRAIVGSGPYRAVRVEPPQTVETVVFDGYDGPRPAIEQVRYLTVSRAETRVLMAEGGQADLAYGLDPAGVARVRKHGKVPLAAVTLPRSAVLKLNCGLPALRDVRVRRALSLAIDRAGIAQALLRDPALAAGQLLAPSLAGWHDLALAPLAHDPEAARRLLAEAGWTQSADGLRGPDGRALRLALRTFVDRPELPIIATALQEQFRQVGVAVQVHIVNSGDVPLGHRDGSLELALIARNYASVPDPTGTLLQDFGPRGGDWGAMGWSSEAVVKALAELSRGGVRAERAVTLRRQVTATLQDELPLIPVAWYRQQVAVNPRLRGVSLDPLERSYRITDMEWAA